MFAPTSDRAAAGAGFNRVLFRSNRTLDLRRHTSDGQLGRSKLSVKALYLSGALLAMSLAASGARSRTQEIAEPVDAALSDIVRETGIPQKHNPINLGGHNRRHPKTGADHESRLHSAEMKDEERIGQRFRARWSAGPSRPAW
jgi:hypothetical protein